MTQTTVYEVDGIQVKPCPTCKRVLPLTGEFWARSNQTVTGFQGMCKDCRYEQYELPQVTGQAKARRGVVYQDSETSRECRECGDVKPVESFLLGKDGWRSWCSDCRSAYNRRASLAKFYGLTPDTYDEMLASQGGVCAVCGQINNQVEANGKRRRLHVDHDHDTGKIRGLLCSHCNIAIGNALDDPARLRALASYLETYK